jgi:hypothetical protein
LVDVTDASGIRCHVRQHNIERGEVTSQLGTAYLEDIAHENPRIFDGNLERLAVNSHQSALGSYFLTRILQPRTRPTAQVEHTLTGVKENVALVDFLQFVDRTSREVLALCPLEEGIVTPSAVS